MNIDELRSAQSKERQKSDLQQLRESFYGDVAEYVEELEAERQSAADAAGDPFGSPEVQQLTNDIETAKDTAEAIYERRLGKIVKKASLVSAEMANPDDVNGLTAEEQALFADLVERIEENKTHMLDVIAGDAPPGPADDRAGASDGASSSMHSTSGTSANASADATASADAGADADATADGPSDANAPHPEDGFDAGEEAPDDDPRPGRSEAAAVAGDDPVADDAPGAGDVPDPGNVSAADLMGGAGDDPGDDDAEPAADANASADEPTADANASVDEPAADANASVDEPDADGSSASSDDADTGDDRATLRVTRDVGEIFGVDEREYRLDAEDVVTLPEENADVLVEQGAAERLE